MNFGNVSVLLLLAESVLAEQGQGQARTPEGEPIKGAGGTYTLEMTNSSGNLNRAEPHAHTHTTCQHRKDQKIRDAITKLVGVC